MYKPYLKEKYFVKSTFFNKTVAFTKFLPEWISVILMKVMKENWRWIM